MSDVSGSSWIFCITISFPSISFPSITPNDMLVCDTFFTSHYLLYSSKKYSIGLSNSFATSCTFSTLGMFSSHLQILLRGKFSLLSKAVTLIPASLQASLTFWYITLLTSFLQISRNYIDRLRKIFYN